MWQRTLKRAASYIFLKKLPLKMRLIFFFSFFIITSVFFVYRLSGNVYLNIITSILDNFRVDMLSSKSSLIDAKLKQYDILSLDLLSNGEVYDILALKENDTYENVTYHKKFSMISSSLAIQLQTSYLNTLVLRSKYDKYFSPSAHAFTGSRKDDTSIDRYDNKLYEQVKKNAGRITFLNTDKYIFEFSTEEKCFGMGRIIQDIGKNELGYVIMFIKYDFFKDVFASPLYGNNSAALCIFNRDGAVIYSQAADGENVTYLQALFEGLPKDKMSLVVKDGNGIPRLVTYYTSPYTGWTIVDMVSMPYLLGSIQLNERFTVLFCLLFVVIAMGVAIYISSSISNPIRSLIGTMNRISNNNFSLRTEVYEGFEIQELCIHFNNMIEKINLLMKETEMKQKSLVKMELSMLQAQINPHFLYNTLNSIRWISIINKQNQIKNLIDSLSRLIMNSFRMPDELITIEDELSILESYVYIMKVRYSNFNIQIEIDDALLHYKILKLTLQPLIENSITHGFNLIEYTGLISIRFEKHADYLIIRVADNGSGIPADVKMKIERQSTEANSGFSRLGISNVNRRIKLHYGSNYGIKIIDNEPVGTIIEITYPLIM